MPVKLQLRIANQQLCAYTIRDTSGSAVVKTDFRGATVGHIDKFALARETSAGTPMKLNRKDTQLTKQTTHNSTTSHYLTSPRITN